MTNYEDHIRALEDKVLADAEQAKKEQLEQLAKSRADIEKMMELAEKNIVMVQIYKAPQEIKDTFKRANTIKFKGVNGQPSHEYVICGTDTILAALAHEPSNSWVKKFEIKNNNRVWINGIQFILVTEYARMALNDLLTAKRTITDLADQIERKEKHYTQTIETLELLKEHVNFEGFNAYEDTEY